MTKDGRPSRVMDLRHFDQERPGYHEAFARRLAWWLNGGEAERPAISSILTLR